MSCILSGVKCAPLIVCLVRHFVGDKVTLKTLKPTRTNRRALLLGIGVSAMLRSSLALIGAAANFLNGGEAFAQHQGGYNTSISCEVDL